MAFRRRSALPGRVRWELPEILRYQALATELSHALLGRRDVHSVTASAVTGRVLVQFDPSRSLDEVEGWVSEALAEAQAVLAGERPRASEKKEAVASSGAPLARLMARSPEYSKLATLALISSGIDRICDVVPTTIVAVASDVAVNAPTSLPARLGFTTSSSQLTALGVGSAVAWVADASAGYVYQVTSAHLANVVQSDLRCALFNHLQELDLQTIEARQVSEWVHLFESDVHRLEDIIKDVVDPIAGLAVNVVHAVTAALAVSPMMALVQVASMPVAYFVAKWFLGPMGERARATREAEKALDSQIMAGISGVSTVYAFNAQEQQALRVRAASDTHAAKVQSGFLLSSTFVPALQVTIGAGFLTTLLGAVKLVREGQLTVGSLNMLGLASIRLLTSMVRVAPALQRYQTTSMALGRVLDVLETRPSLPTGERALPASTVRGELHLQGVTFGYERERGAVLDGVDMRFRAGKTTAIVGTTGSGKSTLLKLLLRFHDPWSGVVRLDGNDLRDLRTEDVRGAIALVSQDVFLFPGSVRDNIALGRPNAPMADIEEAARIAEAHGFIARLPQGYDTFVGERGNRLSGGQRQRLAIARAVLTRRPIFLFDEATSSVDNETEASIQRSLREATRDRTTVIIAHRLSTIRHADSIYVLDDGVVREHGRHDELLARNGIYATFWKIQTGEPAGRPAA